MHRHAVLVTSALFCSCFESDPGSGAEAGTATGAAASASGAGAETSVADDGAEATTGAGPTGGADTSGTITTGADATTGAGDNGDTGEAMAAEFVEIDGLVSVEAEHYSMQVNTEISATHWYTFVAGEPEPNVECVTNVTCSNDTRPDCNQYDECDGDAIPVDEAIGGAYVEALPDRRRDDHEPGTTGIVGVINNPENSATLLYRVRFETPGRYYVWGHARGEGPAANGIHVGIDGTWPRNELVDPSSMRMQFPNGWRWTQNRRGGSQHTGVSGTDEVSRRDANIWLEIATPGVHVIQFGMREDGLEFDKFVMTTNPDYEPEGDGPPETTAP